MGAPPIGSSEKHVATTFSSKLEDITFSVLYSMVHGNNEHNGLLNDAIMLFEDIQLISFAFSPEFFQDMPHWAMYVTNPLSYRPDAFSGFVIMLGIVIGFVVLALLTAVEVAMSFGSGKFAGISLWALKTLRLVTKLLGTILFIPFLEVLLVAVTCAGSDRHLREYPEVTCFSGAYSAQTIIVILSLFIFIPYNIAMSAIYMDTSPSRENKASRSPIGRKACTNKGLAEDAVSRVLLTMIFTLTEVPALKIGVLLAVTIVLSLLIVRYQPFYISAHNELRAALFFASAFAAVVACISFVTKIDSMALPIATAVAAAIGMVVGVITCRSVFNSTTKRVYDRIQLKHRNVGKSLNDLGMGTTATRSNEPEISGDVERGDAFTGTDALQNLHKITSTRTRPKTIHVFQHPGEVEQACRFVHNNRTPEALYIMEEIFGEGFDQFPKNSLLKLMYAQASDQQTFPDRSSTLLLYSYANYLEVYAGSNTQEPAYFVQSAKALHPAFDARFFIFMQDRILEQSKRTEGLNASTLNISSYVEFQTMQNGARRDHLATLIELRSFLSHIRAGQRGRDPKTYPIFLQRISEAEQRATNYYKKLIARWPKSKVLLRMYGSFLLQVKNEREQATKYMMMAEEIEENETRINTNMPIQRHGSTRSSNRASSSHIHGSNRASNTHVNASQRSLKEAGQAIPPKDPYLRSRLDTIMAGQRDSRACESDASMEGLAAVPTVTLSAGVELPFAKRTVEVDVDEFAESKKPVNVVNTSQLRRRMSLGQYNPGSDEMTMEVEPKGVGFNVGPSTDDVIGLGARMPSESAGGSTKSSEREAKLKVYNKMQLQTRLKAPVVRLDRNQKITVIFYIVIVVASFALGLWSFSAAETSIKGFVRGTRLPRVILQLSQITRNLTEIANVPNDPLAIAIAKDRFANSQSVLAGQLSNFTTYYLPYLSAFYQDPYNIDLKARRLMLYPLPLKEIQHFNAYEATKSLLANGLSLSSRDYNYFTDPAVKTSDNAARFFLDNGLDLADAYDAANTIGQDVWVSSSMTNVYVLYGLLGVLIASMLGWGYLIFWPMIGDSYDEQVRTLKMFAMLPKKSLMHMLTEIEEQIESISDEMTAASQVDENGMDEPNSNQNQSAAAAANRLLNRTFDTEVMIKKSSVSKHVIRYGLGILVLALPAISLLVAPIIRALISVNYALTMNYTNNRRWYAQAAVYLGKEALYFDGTTWLPYDPLMQYQNQLSNLAQRHQDAVTGTNCIATTSISALNSFTLGSAPCQPACGNRTMGLDAQIEWLISTGQEFSSSMMQNDVLSAAPRLEFMNTLLTSIVDNLNGLDDACTSLVYLFIFRHTVKARMVEMESAVTLVFAIPDATIQAVPEIKRFIESGGMFTDDAVRKRK
ncbi:hypothetical protein HDU88_004557 [Geranomyces variabilis]|nr:hypothetical protein HDU88_004557 [Geranomyces variabilis]